MLPNFFIIGAMKCGTTSLHHYLGQHPEIEMSRIKELDFFVEELSWKRGLKWYQAQFGGNARVHGEASHNYTAFPRFRDVAPRIHALVPDAKLVYLVRDPIERIISQYIQEYSYAHETRRLELALTAPDRERYLTRSRYYLQIEQFLAFYPSANLLVVDQEDLLTRRRETLRAIFRFLGVDDTFDSPRFSRLIHESSLRRRQNWLGQQIGRLTRIDFVKSLPYDWRTLAGNFLYVPFSSPIPRPRLSERLRAELVNTLAPDIQRFREFTGRTFSQWSL